MTKIVRDEFDSRYLGISAYKLHFDRESPIFLNSSDWVAPDLPTPSMICCTVPWGFGWIEELIKNDFNLIGTKIKYGQKLNKNVTSQFLNTAATVTFLSKNTTENLEVLSDYEILIDTLAKVSRYHKDLKLPISSSKKIYKAWFFNSLFNGYADLVAVAKFDKLNIGLLSVKLSESVAHIDLFVVDPRYHNSGVGTQLLRSVIRHLRDFEVNKIYVETEVENVISNRFYQKNGFLTEEFSLVLHRHFV